MVCREGRASLTTSFQNFKFMVLYSFVSFGSVLILYSFNSNFSDNCFLYIDFLLMFPMAIAMNYTKPYHILSKEKPGSSLLTFSVLFNVIGQICVQIGFQVKKSFPSIYALNRLLCTIYFRCKTFTQIALSSAIGKKTTNAFSAMNRRYSIDR